MEDINTSSTDLVERIERMEEVLSAAACGDVEVRIDLDQNNNDIFTSLETGINLLISDMGKEIQKSRHRRQELEDKLKLIEKQRQAIEELSTPIIKIWDNVLVLPLIGTLDTRRSQKLTEALLVEIATTQTRVTIIDITGVPTVDSAVANHLIKTIAAVRLLGAQAVITGIRPEVAQTIVHLGVDLADVETLSNLAEGLTQALDRLGFKIGKVEKVKGE